MLTNTERQAILDATDVTWAKGDHWGTKSGKR